ncbi:MAG: cytochrome c3 family protein, partial [Thermincolia bacterium]
ANNGSFVSISVYWDDSESGSGIQWANDVQSGGGKLNYQSTGLTYSGLGTIDAYALLPNAEKYKNYYFKLTKGGKISIIRAFPVDFNSGVGPRYQNDYVHGNFQPNTAMCAGCHVTHTGLKAKLLNQATYYDLCLFCHGTAASQSKYDVQSGKVNTATGWKGSLAGPIGTDFGVSKHNVDDRSNVNTTVYGSAPGKNLTFTCITCHKPHGGNNDNYRLLRETIYPSNDRFTSTTVAYTAYAVVRNQTVGEEVYMVSGNTEFCTACHLDYDNGDAHTMGGMYNSYYRHPVTVGNKVYSVYRSSPLRNWYPAASDNLPLQVYSAGESIGPDKRTAIVCSTCHYAHGSYKNFNMGYPQPSGIQREYVANQKMLRLDNYGVCESCHKK